MRYVYSLVLLALTAASLSAGQKPTQALNAHQQLARAIFKELVEINTTDSTGDCTKAAEAMAARFRAGGFAPVMSPSSGRRRKSRTSWCACAAQEPAGPSC